MSSPNSILSVLLSFARGCVRAPSRAPHTTHRRGARPRVELDVWATNRETLARTLFPPAPGAARVCDFSLSPSLSRAHVGRARGLRIFLTCRHVLSRATSLVSLSPLWLPRPSLRLLVSLRAFSSQQNCQLSSLPSGIFAGLAGLERLFLVRRHCCSLINPCVRSSVAAVRAVSNACIRRPLVNVLRASPLHLRSTPRGCFSSLTPPPIARSAPMPRECTPLVVGAKIAPCLFTPSCVIFVHSRRLPFFSLSFLHAHSRAAPLLLSSQTMC